MITTAPIHEHGEVVGALGIIRDVTNDEIRRETNAHQARLAAVGQSLSRVANELNNPLASLLAVAELQATSPTMLAQDRRAIEQICEQAHRASRIVSLLLDSTGDASHTAGQRGRVDVNALVRRAIEWHGYGWREHGIVVDFTAGEDLPAMSGDAIQLHQAVSNLLTNAEEALIDADGARCIRVVTRAGATGVEVQVSDTGPGIATHELARVFEPMFTTRADGGHRGLGLTIARTIAQDHGGALEAHSRAGEGAVFTLSFPALPEPTTAPRDTDAPLGAPVPKGSLLLIEDEITLRSAISRFLRNAGYVVDVADGGAEALDLAADRPYDLILLDLRMNGLTGEQVYQSIESRDPEQARRVVFMTGDLHNADASRFIRRTGRPVLAKPFTLLDLETRVAQLLQEPR
jgi:nitrogen-specific signal transduction histidine kinase/CheY-like chemotaxis protein